MEHPITWKHNLKGAFWLEKEFDSLKNDNVYNFIELLQKNDLYISDKPTYFYSKGYSSDTRATIYYRRIGLFRLTIEAKIKSDNSYSITIERVRKVEGGTKKLQQLSFDTEEDWEAIFNKRTYYHRNIEAFFKDLENLKAIIDLSLDDTKIEDLDLKLKAINVYNFKKIKHTRMELTDNLQILVGSNNAGKSSFIQGVLLAYQTLLTLSVNNKISFNRDGSISFKSANLPSSRIEKFPFLLGSPYDLFNKETKLDITKSVRLFKLEFQEDQFITINGRIVGDVFSVFISDASNRISNKAIKKFVSKPITLIPSFFNVVINEERKSPARYDSLLKAGNYNQLFRNILWDLKEKVVGIEENEEESLIESNENEKSNAVYNKFSELQQIVDQVFGVKDLNVEFDADTHEYILATYQIASQSNGRQERLDISTLGMGTLQFIQVITQVLLGTPNIILLDEPDAHLHSKLQVKIINLLKNFANNYGIQFIVATHSKDIINNVNHRQVFSFNDKNELTTVEDMSGFIGTVKSLGATTEEIIGLSLGKRIVIVEGEDDIHYIKKIYETFNPDYNNSNYNLINFKAFGGRSNVLTNHMDKMLGNTKELEDFEKIAIFDKDYRFEEEQHEDAEKLRKKGFYVRELTKKELENYFLIPSLIAKTINKMYANDNYVTEQQIEEVINEYYKKVEQSIIHEFAQIIERKELVEYKRKYSEDFKYFKEIEFGKAKVVHFFEEAKKYLETQEKKDVISGKEVLDEIRAKLIEKATPSRKEFICSLICCITEEHVHEDIKDLLNKIKEMSY